MSICCSITKTVLLELGPCDPLPPGLRQALPARARRPDDRPSHLVRQRFRGVKVDLGAGEAVAGRTSKEPKVLFSFGRKSASHGSARRGIAATMGAVVLVLAPAAFAA